MLLAECEKQDKLIDPGEVSLSLFFKWSTFKSWAGTTENESWKPLETNVRDCAPATTDQLNAIIGVSHDTRKLSGDVEFMYRNSEFKFTEKKACKQSYSNQ